MFISRSAIPVSQRHNPRRENSGKIQEVVYVDHRKYVYVIGQENPELKECGEKLGFKVEFLNQIPFSRLSKAAGIIYNNATSADFINKVRTFNFCLSYQIPIIWTHEYVLPVNWMSQFESIFVGDFELMDVWRSICDLV